MDKKQFKELDGFEVQQALEKIDKLGELLKWFDDRFEENLVDAMTTSVGMIQKIILSRQR